MTRFHELQRIQAAIKNRNEKELRWALSYARMRLRIAKVKHHQKHWKAIEKKVRAALEAFRREGTAE